ncbi:plasmid recombination protein [Vagococcus martis]|nr:plasmid recombination protein [Vagococcus martis]
MSTQKEFFKATVDFLNERYGSQNVLSATVHHDETTPLALCLYSCCF